MNNRKIGSLEQIDRDLWEEFVLAHPDGTIFQSPMMFTVQREAQNHSPFVFAVRKEGRIAGILSGVILKEYSGPVGSLTARGIVTGGPLVEGNDPKAALELLRIFSKWARGKAIYSQFRNLCGLEWCRPAFESLRYRYEEHLNFLVDLTRSESDLWGDIHGKRRNEIRRAQKEGTIFSERSDQEALSLGYGIIRNVYRYARLPLPEIDLFRNLLAISKESAGLRIFSAYNQGKMIGVMFALVYKNRIYDWYAGADRDHLDKYPNDLLPWEVMKWGRNHGYEVFDFGGAGKPDVPYGVRDYKSKFGGKRVNFGRFERVHQPIKMEIGKLGFKVWRLVRK